jgi:anti-sigma B factor antagonist
MRIVRHYRCSGNTGCAGDEEETLRVGEKLNFETYVTQAGDVTVAAPHGPLDSATLDKFQEVVGPLCAHGGSKVLLDCTNLTYMNSRAIGLLMKYHRGLLVSRGHFALCCLNSKLVRTLDLLQIGKTLAIHSTREEALAALK